MADGAMGYTVEGFEVVQIPHKPANNILPQRRGDHTVNILPQRRGDYTMEGFEVVQIPQKPANNSGSLSIKRIWGTETTCGECVRRGGFPRLPQRRGE